MGQRAITYFLYLLIHQISSVHVHVVNVSPMEYILHYINFFCLYFEVLKLLSFAISCRRLRKMQGAYENFFALNLVYEPY